MAQEQSKTLLLAAIGARVRKLRLGAGLTVKEFAARASLSPRFVNQLEAGLGNISISGLARAAAALDVSLLELIPPPESDRSRPAWSWRILSDCTDEDLIELEAWLERRKGAKPRREFIALIGLRGAGKSTIGPLLAKKVRKKFVEVDALIEQAAGMSLGEIFNLHGEQYYRRLERAALMECFARSRGCVLAPGGSVVSDPEMWELLKKRCFTVFLHATPDEFMRRMRRQGDLRPMQGYPSAMNELKSLLLSREALYSESQLTIRTTNKTPASIVTQIIKAIG